MIFSAVHNGSGAAFLFVFVFIPLAWIVVMALLAGDKPSQPTRLKSREMPLRRDEVAGYVESRIKREQGRVK